jgi:hypothetical protein
MVERIDHSAIIGAVTGRLHDDIAGETEMIAQGKELGPRRIAGRILTLGRVREFDARTKDMTMRVDRA